MRSSRPSSVVSDYLMLFICSPDLLLFEQVERPGRRRPDCVEVLMNCHGVGRASCARREPWLYYFHCTSTQHPPTTVDPHLSMLFFLVIFIFSVLLTLLSQWVLFRLASKTVAVIGWMNQAYTCYRTQKSDTQSGQHMPASGRQSTVISV